MSIKIKELPSSERPYEKLQLYGEKSLSNAELLAIIIKTGTKENTSVELAQKILKLNDTTTDELNFLRNLSIEDFMQIKGIGKVKAIQLKAVCELAIRMTKPSDYRNIIVKNPETLAKILMSELAFEKSEIVKVVVLNNANKIMKMKNISLGGTNFANVDVSSILVEPIKMNAPKIILVHNHPSGNATPSKQDIDFTYKLYDMAQKFDIELLDHIVIGFMKFTSIFTCILNKK